MAIAGMAFLEGHELYRFSFLLIPIEEGIVLLVLVLAAYLLIKSVVWLVLLLLPCLGKSRGRR